MQRLKDDTEKPNSKLMYLFRDGIKLGYALTGKNISNINDKNIKALSPRFFSVTSDQDDEKVSTLCSLLGPSDISYIIYLVPLPQRGIESVV